VSPSPLKERGRIEKRGVSPLLIPPKVRETKRGEDMKLAITQIVLAALILTDCLCFVITVSPLFLCVVPVLGLAVLGIGIAQFLKAKA